MAQGAGGAKAAAGTEHKEGLIRSGRKPGASLRALYPPTDNTEEIIT
jgi:hypothetical protein